MKATCYHARDMQGAKVVGGSLGISDLNTAAKKAG